MSLPVNRNLLAKYRGNKRVFIETGAFRGDGIQQAIDAGFSVIRSLELDVSQVDFCHHRFDLYRSPGNFGVEVLRMDSATDLGVVLANMIDPAVIFLDAHWQMLEDELKPPNPFPLLDELRQIESSDVDSHTILIDDWHIFYKDRVGYDKKDILWHLKCINPNYKISYEANPVIDGICVAHL